MPSKPFDLKKINDLIVFPFALSLVLTVVVSLADTDVLGIRRYNINKLVSQSVQQIGHDLIHVFPLCFVFTVAVTWLFRAHADKKKLSLSKDEKPLQR